MRALIVWTLALAAALGAAPASAQRAPLALSPTGQPTSWTLTGEAPRVTGYGPFRFGMTPDEVKAAVAAQWPHAAASLTDTVEPVDRTRAMGVVLASLAPAPGVPTVSFVFGASSRTLMAINISWLLDGNPDAAQRDALVRGAAELGSAFAGDQWPELATARGHVIGRHALVVFAGRDEHGGGVEIRLDGVAMDLIRPGAGGQGTLERRAAPAGPARLRLALAVRPDRPDVYRIAPGQF